MTSRIRIKLIAFAGVLILTLLNSFSFGQQRGGGGGGRGGGGGGGGRPEPTEVYINQLELEGKEKGAFRKAYNANERAVSKWRANVQKFQKKNKKYIGVENIDPAIIEQIKAEKAELDAQQKANADAYRESLAAFLSPQQMKRFEATSKRIAEQRAQRARRAAGGGGGGNRQRPQQ